MAGALIGLLGGYYGSFLVQRGLSFLGSGLAHAAFGGVALGIFLEQSPPLVAMPFTVLVSIGITYIRKSTRLTHDTAVGILFAISMALGIALLSMRREYSADAVNYLFGSILAVERFDIILLLILTLITILLIPMWKRWAYATFDAELARADRLHVDRDDYILSAILALLIVSMVKAVGAVLASAFLVIPAATARLLTRTFFTMTILSIVFAIGGSLVGLFVAYEADIPAGAGIILIQGSVFGIVGLYNKFAR